MQKERELKDLDVTFISLVDKGANMKTIIWKSADQEEGGISKTIEILKADDEKHLVYGIVYAPDEIDSHGDMATAEEIEKAAHRFMKAARTQSVDHQHDLNADKGYVAESWIVRKNDELFEEEGAWAVAIKVEDEETWQMVKSGNIGGISLYGTATAIEKAKEADQNLAEDALDQNEQPALGRIRKWLSERVEDIKKGFRDRVGHNALTDAVYALWYAHDDILYNDRVTDKRAALVFEAQQFIDYINGLEGVAKEADNPGAETTETMETPEQATGLEAKVDALTETVGKLAAVVEKMAAPEAPEEAPKEAPEEVEKADETIQALQARIDALEKASAGRQTAETRVEKEEAPAKGIQFFG